MKNTSERKIRRRRSRKKAFLSSKWLHTLFGSQLLFFVRCLQIFRVNFSIFLKRSTFFTGAFFSDRCHRLCGFAFKRQVFLGWCDIVTKNIHCHAINWRRFFQKNNKNERKKMKQMQAHRKRMRQMTLRPMIEIGIACFVCIQTQLFLVALTNWFTETMNLVCNLTIG